MRHQRKTVKLGRTSAHRNALIANQICSLIQHHRIKTTLAKAKAVKPEAEKMVTLAKRGTLHARRLAIAALRQEDAVRKLFDVIAPVNAERQGGYCRIVKLGERRSDSAPMALLEWVDLPLAGGDEDDVIVPPAKEEKKKAVQQEEPKMESGEGNQSVAESEATPEAAPETEPGVSGESERPKD